MDPTIPGSTNEWNGTELSNRKKAIPEAYAAIFCILSDAGSVSSFTEKRPNNGLITQLNQSTSLNTYNQRRKGKTVNRITSQQNRNNLYPALRNTSLKHV